MFRRLLAAFSSGLNGNLPGRDLVGGSPRSSWLGARLSQPNRHNRPRAADGQPAMGEGAPGNLLLPARLTHLPNDSVANVSQILAMDRDLLIERVSKLSRTRVELLLAGIDVVLGR